MQGQIFDWPPVRGCMRQSTSRIRGYKPEKPWWSESVEMKGQKQLLFNLRLDTGQSKLEDEKFDFSNKNSTASNSF